MKKSWRILGAGLLVLSLAATGCGGAGKSKAEVEKALQTDYKGTIVIWDGPDAASKTDNKFEWIESKAKEFEQANPGVKVEIVQTPWAEFGQKLGTAIAGGAWPDLAAVDISGGGVNLKHIDQGLIVQTDNFMTKEEVEDLYPVAREAYSYNGKLYGFPTALTVHAMLLNLEIFKAAGVEPPKDGKWTYDEFVAKMKALNGKDYQGRKVVPFSTYVLKGYYEPWPFLLMDGGQILSKDGKQITIDSKEFVSGVQKLADLKMTHKVTDPLFGTDKVGDNFQNFGNIEKRYVAVEPWASWAIASLRTGAKYKMDFMVAEYPTGKTGKPVTIGGAGGYVVFEPKDKNAARRAMAVKFAKFISTPEVQIRHAQERGVFPASKKAAAADPFKDIPQMKAAQKLMDNAVAPPKHESWTQMQDLISAELQLVLNGEKTPEKAMADAKKNIEPLLLKK
ncbi:MAG TPA: extracellular solute-binding protein [Symbiobacteriaceae bacterium]|nr:extracellular solute-binding protein [Symbiobacteriaceae bacterium]